MCTINFIVMVYFINIKQGFCLVLLLETHHSIVQNIDEGKLCCMVFCDHSKAFDRVWHKGLLFLITNLCNICFPSYLGHRSQKVMYKD